MEPQGNRRYYLYSFAPSTGIGFYRDRDQVFQFDLVTEEDVPLSGPDLGSSNFEFDQVTAGISFEELSELKTLARDEYLRDKKNTYYACLFTTRLSKKLRLKTLELLDDPQFAEVKLSPKAVATLREIGKPSLVSLTLKEASHLRLKFVQECFYHGELKNVVKSLKPNTLFSDLVEAIWLPIVQAITNFLFSVFKIPEVLRFISLRESKTRAPTLETLTNLYSHDIFKRDFHDWFYFLSEIPVSPNRELQAVGKQIWANIFKWEVIRSDVGWGMVPRIKLSFTEDWSAKHVQKLTFETCNRWSNKSAFNRTTSNLLFSLDFCALERIREKDFQANSQQYAFFLAFYSSPWFATEQSFEKYQSMRPLDWDWWFPYAFVEQTYWSSEIGRRSSLAEVYRTINFLSVAVLSLVELPSWHSIDQLVRIFNRWHEPKLFKKLELPDPWVVLLSNLLSWSVQTKQEELFNRLIVILREVKMKETDLRPYIRFIL